MNFKKITYSIMLLGMTATLSAQSTSGGEAVGTPSGSLSVSDMGAAVYSLNFEVPDGGPLTPQVGIAYNSQQAGYGLAGYGFNITGISCITRGGKDMFHDGTLQGVTYTADDNFYLDGKRLILKSGTAGEDGAVYTPEGNPYMEVKLHSSVKSGYWYNDGQEQFYIDEDDDISEYPEEVVFPYSETIIWFQATVGGITQYFGKSDDSKLFIKYDDGSKIDVAWYINRTEDQHENYVNYNYFSDSYSMSIRPTSIANKHCRISFSYSGIGYSNRRSFYIKDKKGWFEYLLSSVYVYYDGNLFRKYEMEYAGQSDQCTGKWYRLTSVSVSNKKGEKLRPITFDWEFLPSASISTKSLGSIPVNKSNRFIPEGNSSFFATDLTGDGISEIIRIVPVDSISGNVRYSRTYMYISNSNAAGTNVDSYSYPLWYSLDPATSLSPIGGTNVMDLDGDGMNDLILTRSFLYDEYFQVIFGKNVAKRNSLSQYFSHPIKNKNANPLFIAFDVDGDGKDEVVCVEQGKVDGSYHMFIVGHTDGNELEHTDFDLYLPKSPQRIFSGDYNNDGLSDLLILYETGYKIYYNCGGNSTASIFNARQSKTLVSSSAFKNHTHVEQGDFNGDGLGDFIYNDSGSPDLYVAICKGDGTFSMFKTVTSEVTSNQNDYSIKVWDIDHDGYSDVMISRSGKKTQWLLSNGVSFSSYNSFSSIDVIEGGESPSCIFLGDFDGDGYTDLANYGSCLISEDNAFVEDKINIYKSGGDMSQVGKITSVTDGYGNRTDIQYAFATSPSVYKRTSGNEYPVNTYTLPLSVVANVTSDDGLTTKYSYEDLKIHIGGRGMLGFNSVTKENAILGTKEITKIIDWDTQYWLPKKTVSTSTIDGSTSTVTSTFTIADVNDNYFVYESKRDVTDLDGNEISTSTQYDTENGVILSETVENDGQNMFKKVEYADYQKKTCGWLPAKMTRTQKHKDDSAPYSNTTKYIYDDDGNVLSSTSNVGTSMELTTTATYDEYGNVLTSVSSGNGVKPVKQCYEYDATGFHVTKSYTLPASTVTEYAYDKMGNLLTETDLTNPSHPLTTRYTYDAWGRRDTTISPLGIRTRYEIGWGGTDERKYYAKVVADGQAPVTTWYDKRGHETFSQSIGPKGIDVTKTTTYNQKGQVEHVESTTGNQTTTNDFTYDARGRVVTEASSSGKSVSYSYGNRTVTTTVAGRSYTTTSDAWGNVVQSTDPISSVEYTYCSNGQPKQVMANGSVVTMEYDAVGNQTKLVDPDAGTMTYTYAADGTLLTQTDARNVKTINTYDDLGRLISTKIGDKTITYTYGTSGNENMMLVSQSMDGHTLEYKHDELGRVIQKKQILNGIGTLQYDYAYNTRGQLASIVYPGGLDVNYSYDENGFKSLVVADGRAIYYLKEYDGLTSNVSFMDKLNTIRTLDERGLLSSQQVFKGTTRKDGFTYEFDGATGNLLSRARRSGTPTTFEYDALDRLVSENGTSTIQFSYAPNGNILSKTNVGNYSYDWAVHPHAVSHIDNIFKRVPSDILNTEFNAFGKIQTIEDEGSGLRMDFTYGPDQQRWRTVLCDSTGTMKRATIYGENYENVTENGVTREFYYLDGNVLMIRQDDDFTPYLMQKDHLGTICSVLNDNGTFVYYANYDAWGKQNVGRNYIGLHRGYTGHEMLDEFGIINMNGRLYDPVIGRFFSPDNYVQMPTSSQSFNRYSYCLNNPLKYTDPSGEFWEIVVGAVIGAYMGGVLANDSYNPTKWDYHSPQTWGYMVSGAFVGGISAGAGAAVAGSGVTCSNTLGIMTASAVNSLGTYAYTLGETPISVSAGAVSYDFTNGKFGYLGKKGNSKLENLGYFFGAMENLHDINNLFDATKQPLRTPYKYRDINKNGKEVFKLDFVSHADLGELWSYGPDNEVPAIFDISGTIESLMKVDVGNAFDNPILEYTDYALRLSKSKVNYGIDSSETFWKSRDLFLNKYLWKGFRNLGRKVPYQALTLNCVNTASLGLWLNGIPNIGLHPWILHGTVTLYNTGIYSNIASLPHLE